MARWFAPQRPCRSATRSSSRYAEPDGTPFNNQETVPIAINGSLGTRHILVWNHPGAKNVIVVAGQAGAIEKLTASVQVTPRTDNRRPVRVSALRVPSQPTAARFVVEGVDASGLLGKPTRGVRNGQPVSRLTAAGKPAARLAVIGSGGEATPIFTWDLGDNQPVGSNIAEYVHDFTERLDPNRGYQVFPVRLTVRTPNQAPVVVERTVTVYNPYFLSKQRGVLQPPVVSANLNATFVLGNYLGAFRVYNPEPDDLTLTSLEVEPSYPNPTEVARLPGPPDNRSRRDGRGPSHGRASPRRARRHSRVRQSPDGSTNGDQANPGGDRRASHRGAGPDRLEGEVHDAGAGDCSRIAGSQNGDWLRRALSGKVPRRPRRRPEGTLRPALAHAALLGRLPGDCSGPRYPRREAIRARAAHRYPERPAVTEQNRDNPGHGCTAGLGRVEREFAADAPARPRCPEAGGGGAAVRAG